MTQRVLANRLFAVKCLREASHKWYFDTYREALRQAQYHYCDKGHECSLLAEAK